MRSMAVSILWALASAGRVELFDETPTTMTFPPSVTAVEQLARRLLGAAHAAHFKLSINPQLAIGGVVSKFELSSTSPASGLTIRGSDAVAVAVGLNHYLKLVNASVSWAATGGDNIDDVLPPPSELLSPVKPVAQSTTLGRRYYMNTCTYGYSTAWWSWERWEREIDLMALRGINTPLAMLGTEWVWRETFMRDFGLAR